MIKTLSPYYVTTPFVLPSGQTCTKYTLEIYIYTGDKGADTPADPTYSITINNPTASTGNSKVNISRLINDYIEFTPVVLSGNTALENSNNQIWVRTQTKYYVNDVLINFNFNQDTQIAVQGYGYGLSGENPDTPANKILMRVGDYTMKDSDGFFIVPIELDETVPTPPTIGIVSIIQDGVTLDAEIVFNLVGDFEYMYLTIENTGTGDITFIALTDPYTSPQDITFPDYGNWDCILTGYDTVSNTNINSSVYNVTFTP